jgi:hypothetical protein
MPRSDPVKSNQGTGPVSAETISADNEENTRETET